MPPHAALARGFASLVLRPCRISQTAITTRRIALLPPSAPARAFAVSARASYSSPGDPSSRPDASPAEEAGSKIDSPASGEAELRTEFEVPVADSSSAEPVTETAPPVSNQPEVVSSESEAPVADSPAAPVSETFTPPSPSEPEVVSSESQSDASKPEFSWLSEPEAVSSESQSDSSKPEFSWLNPVKPAEDTLMPAAPETDDLMGALFGVKPAAPKPSADDPIFGSSVAPLFKKSNLAPQKKEKQKPKTRSGPKKKPYAERTWGITSRNHRIPAPAGLPAYPHGDCPTWNVANQGLMGGASIRYGNKVANGDKVKARQKRSPRRWKPNVHFKRLESVALGTFVRVRLTTRVLRTIKKSGGLDKYLLGIKAQRIKDLGPWGWKLRWIIMQTPTIKRRFIHMRKEMKVPEAIARAHEAIKLAALEAAAEDEPSAADLQETRRMLAAGEEFALGDA